MREYNLIMPRPWLDRAVVEKIADMRTARYLGDTQIPVRPFTNPEDIEWSTMAVSLFWQDNPPGDYTNAFAAYRKHGRDLVLCGVNGFGGKVNAIFMNKPRIATYSSHGHDMHALDSNGNVCIDGGRHYGRVVGDPGSYEHGIIDLFAQTLVSHDGEILGKLKQKFKGW